MDFYFIMKFYMKKNKKIQLNIFKDYFFKFLIDFNQKNENMDEIYKVFNLNFYSKITSYL
jgi:hypothetical protein